MNNLPDEIIKLIIDMGTECIDDYFLPFLAYFNI